MQRSSLFRYFNAVSSKVQGTTSSTIRIISKFKFNPHPFLQPSPGIFLKRQVSIVAAGDGFGAALMGGQVQPAILILAVSRIWSPDGSWRKSGRDTTPSQLLTNIAGPQVCRPGHTGRGGCSVKIKTNILENICEN